METLSPSIHTVYCVAKRTVERASIYSVSDGITVYLITLKGNQIPKLQEGETYIIENATVKDDHPVPVMILGNETEVFRTAPLQLDEKLIRKAQESINPSSERAALNDPGLYLKKGYITLTGEVVSVSAPQPIKGDTSVRYIEIEEAGVRVTVSLQKEATTEPLIKDQEIKITHVKVSETKLSGKKLMSSDYTDISRTERSLINIVGLATKDSNKVLLTEDRQKLNVHSSVWHEDPDQLLQTLPVELEITKRGQEVMQVKKPDSEKFPDFASPPLHTAVGFTSQYKGSPGRRPRSPKEQDRRDHRFPDFASPPLHTAVGFTSQYKGSPGRRPRSPKEQDRRDHRMETLCSSVPRVHCVVKRTVQRASKFVISGDSKSHGERRCGSVFRL
ncbi:uncharacterized protein LOC108416169 isoform X3 [Pygocentrus nattereri]|nr:uncharacterized protein LOC108416169 isoform X3 [Pygocentrus nattereri]XP_037402166.1 uncharacterized protein LOC108416169 isoform X3 [Pygocentrus nattereri]